MITGKLAKNKHFTLTAIFPLLPHLRFVPVHQQKYFRRLQTVRIYSLYTFNLDYSIFYNQ